MLERKVSKTRQIQNTDLKARLYNDDLSTRHYITIDNGIHPSASGPCTGAGRSGWARADGAWNDGREGSERGRARRGTSLLFAGAIIAVAEVEVKVASGTETSLLSVHHGLQTGSAAIATTRTPAMHHAYRRAALAPAPAPAPALASVHDLRVESPLHHRPARACW